MWIRRHSLGGNAHLWEPRLRKPSNFPVYALCLCVCDISPRASELHHMKSNITRKDLGHCLAESRHSVVWFSEKRKEGIQGN